MGNPDESSSVDAFIVPQIADDSSYDQDNTDDIDNSNEQLYRWILEIPRIKENHLLSSPYSKRSSSSPPQKKFRPHWSPLVAAYKRCGELIRDKREKCFKNAVQMLFVHKLKK
ncbi:unnamed protein product [Didymodactylos carnosus]|uniref:Uncharacterized protein n=1 Tax=Didymodactylos carnosus TaxID=1234261 RepID=A0A813RCE3_9BILA|nr:unnamed protein product [Didymodactylos carnosus]CAF1618536.1 unnamed protein product [Didymodactylos carnosus]CAF3563705.1 unnamed protein product [Didymodactylos carnosus]CAF4436621.1 unnamed protein product [Didymodactylos carnosus]